MNLVRLMTTHGWYLLTAALCAASAAVVFWPESVERVVNRPTPYSIVVATPSQPGAGLVHVAMATDSFSSQEIRVDNLPVFSGSKALDALLQGKADLAIVPDTPFVMATMRGESLGVIGTIYRSRRTLALVARSDRGIAHPRNLADKRIGVPFETTAQFFLDTMLLVNGVKESEAQVIDVPEEKLMDVLQDGTVDAVAVWNMHLIQPGSANLGTYQTFHGEELYSYHLNVVGRQDYIAQNKPMLQRFLAGLHDASERIQQQPLMARGIIASASNLLPDVLDKTFDPGEFRLHLDQSLLLALDDQSRWSIQRKFLSPRPLPNYLHHIEAAPLYSVAPAAVTIIR